MRHRHMALLTIVVFQSRTFGCEFRELIPEIFISCIFSHTKCLKTYFQIRAPEFAYPTGILVFAAYAIRAVNLEKLVKNKWKTEKQQIQIWKSISKIPPDRALKLNLNASENMNVFFFKPCLYQSHCSGAAPIIHETWGCPHLSYISTTEPYSIPMPTILISDDPLLE